MNSKQLKKINIVGFKSIKESSVELDMLNVLIGSNGAGKSNFISVFTLLNNVIKKELQKYIAACGGANTFLFNGSKETTLMRLHFKFGSNSYGFDLSKTDNDTFYFEDEWFGYHYSVNYIRSISSGHPESKLEKEIGNGITWRVYHFHDTSRNARIKTSCDLADNMYLQFDAGNLAAFLLRLKNEHKNNYDDIIKTIQLIAPYFSDFILVPSNGSGSILLKWRQVGSDDIFNANQFSDGTLRFICLAVLLLQPKELQPETIIIDEPELGLHPYAVTIFSELAKKISCNKQIILSTQSVDLLSEFESKDIIVVDRTIEGSTFKRLNEEELKEWLENDYSLGELWKKNILGGRLSK